MIESLSKNMTPDQVAVLLAAGYYLLKELIQFAKDWFRKTSDKTEENTTAVIALTTELKHFNNRIVVIEEKIKRADETEKIVYKLEKDVGFAHEKIREIKDRL
ncbi:hypothetical protein EKK58_08730 [Candidatus Dependentiae bacterium]|nr:MAG: hypothetical protein EKK58_08730 [Candidatus Dependentiae bacterium]